MAEDLKTNEESTVVTVPKKREPDMVVGISRWKVGIHSLFPLELSPFAECLPRNE